METEGLKKCSRCGESFPMTEEYFYLWHDKKSGRCSFASRCRKCQAQYLKERHELNKDHDNELSRIRRVKHYRENKEKTDEKTRQYRAEHTDLVREWNRNRQRKRRERERNIKSSLTHEEWEMAKKEFSDACAYCGSKRKLEKDHFIPVVQGGELSSGNILPACPRCNRSKRTLSFAEWYHDQPFYSERREKHILSYIENQKEKAQ